MSNLIAIIILSAMLFLSIKLSKQGILSPAVIFFSVFLVGFLVLTILGRLELTVHTNTILLIILSGFFILAGNIAANLAIKNRLKSPSARCNAALTISNEMLERVAKISIVFMCFAFLYTASEVLLNTNVNQIEPNQTIVGAFRAQGASKSLLASVLNGAASSITYCLVYLFLRKLIDNKEFQPILLIPIMLYLPVSMITGARIQLLYLVCVVIAVLGFIWIRYNKIKPFRISRKMLLLSLVSVASCIAIFYLSGFITGKSLGFSLSDIVLVYVGGPICGLDAMLNQYSLDIGSGLMSLGPLHGLLAGSGVDIGLSEFGYQIDGQFGYYAIMPDRGLYGNTYTALFYWFHDFGLIGLIIVCFVVGFFFSYLANVAPNLKYMDEFCCAFSIMYIPMFFISITDLFSDNFNPKRLLIILCSFLIVFLLNHGSNQNETVQLEK